MPASLPHLHHHCMFPDHVFLAYEAAVGLLIVLLLPRASSVYFTKYLLHFCNHSTPRNKSQHLDSGLRPQVSLSLSMGLGRSLSSTIVSQVCTALARLTHAQSDCRFIVTQQPLHQAAGSWPSKVKTTNNDERSILDKNLQSDSNWPLRKIDAT